MGPLVRKNSMTCNLNEGLLKQRWYIPAVVGWICITDKSPIHLMPMWLWSCANLVLLWEWQFCKGIAERHTVPRLLGTFSASWLKIGLRVAELNLFWQNPSLCQVLCVTMTVWCPDSSGATWVAPTKGSFVKMAGGEKALQGLRGLSALYLLLYHSLSRTKWPQGWLVDLQVQQPPQTCFNKTFLLWLKEEHHLFIPPFSFPGRDSDAPVLPYFWLLFGSLLWASIAYSGIKIWARRTKTFAEFQRFFLISSTSRLTNDPLSDLWPLRAPPKEFPSQYFYKARLGEWDSPILQTILPGLQNLKYAWVVYGIFLHLSPLSSYLSLPARVLPLYMLSNLLCIPLIHWGFVSDGNILLPEVICYHINSVLWDMLWFGWKDIMVSIVQGSLRLFLNLVSTFSFTNTWFLLLLGGPPSITSW